MLRYNTWSIDSLKIRIPLAKVKILDKGIDEIVLRVSESSGEVLESIQNTKVSRDERGIKTVFSIEQRATEYKTIQYLIILVNAKQLQGQYFEGITQSNFIYLFEYLMSLKAVSFTPHELLEAECTDIDIKKDFEAKESDMKEVLIEMKKNATPSIDYDKGSKRWWEKDNKGLQFNKRNTTKFRTAPFLKIYSKSLDLKTKSNLFAVSCLNMPVYEAIPKNLWRLEYTIKNKKHLELNGIDNTFSALLKLSQSKMEAICQTSLKAVLEQRVRDIVAHNDKIPPKDLILVNALIWLLDEGKQWTVIKRNLIGSLKGYNRSKKLTYLDSLYQSYIRPIKGYSKHQNLDSIFNQIGYTF